MAERFPSGPSPPFPRKQHNPPGSARSSPGREAAKRPLDGEDRSGIIQGEGKGGTAGRESTTGRLHKGRIPHAALRLPDGLFGLDDQTS